MCSWDWPQTPLVTQDMLEVFNLPASISQYLRLQLCIIIPGLCGAGNQIQGPVQAMYIFRHPKLIFI